MWKSLSKLFVRDVGIDLGTSSTLIYVKDRGIVLSEPSVVAIERDTNQIISVGKAAKKMIGRTPQNMVCIRPLRDGVICDFDVCEAMLRHFLLKALVRKTFTRSRVVICAPSGVTPVEKNAVKDVALQAGASRCFIIDELMAAAIGAGLPVNEPIGSMIVDVGAGTTEVGVISLGGCVYVHSSRIAGDDIDEAIAHYVKHTFNFLIGEDTSEQLKIKLGSAKVPGEPTTGDDERTERVRGRDLVSGGPRTLELKARHIQEAIAEPVNTIIEAVRTALEHTPPELSADVAEQGITLTGGCAYIRNLDSLITHHTGLTVQIAKDPLTCVVRGAAEVLNEMETLAALT